jgi:hypothetical protein
VEVTDVVDIVFQALVYAKSEQIADVTQGDEGIVLTTNDGKQTQAWVIQRSGISETAPVD